MTIEDEPQTVDYLVMEFPGDTMSGPGLALLADLVDGGVGRVVDLVFIRKDLDGSTRVIDAGGLSEDVQLDLAALGSLRSGRLSHLDIAAAAAHIDAGSSAGVIVFEGSAEASEPTLATRSGVRRRRRGAR